MHLKVHLLGELEPGGQSFSTGPVSSARASVSSGRGCPDRGHGQKVLFIMHELRTCPGAVGQWFVNNGYRIDIRKPRWGDTLPETLDGYCGVIAFGGNMSVNDPLDYIRTEIDWMDVPLRENRPYLGICLGAQLLVKFLGGEVCASGDGSVEAGYYPVRPTGKTAYRQEPGLLPKSVFEWHREGFGLPSGMSCFLEGQGAESFGNQAVFHGTNHFGLQFHPEVTERIVRRWVTILSDMLTEKGSHNRETLLREHLFRHLQSRQWLDRFLTHWCRGSLVTG